MNLGFWKSEMGTLANSVSLTEVAKAKSNQQPPSVCGGDGVIWEGGGWPEGCWGCAPTLGDVDNNTSDTSTPTHNKISSPITRAHARQLNNQVKHGTNSSSMMSLCFELTSYAFQLTPFTYCYYRKHMEVGWWHTLVSRRGRTFLLLNSFGPGWEEMWCDLLLTALHVKRLSHD
jgi:hypothetical protein